MNKINLHDFINKLPMELINKIYSYTSPSPTAALMKPFITEYHDPMKNDFECGLIWIDAYSFANDYFNFYHDEALIEQPSKYYSINSHCYFHIEQDPYTDEIGDYLFEMFYTSD